MAAGHGGQILVAASTAALLRRVDLLDLGEHRLRDLSGSERLLPGGARTGWATFPPLRTDRHRRRETSRSRRRASSDARPSAGGRRPACASTGWSRSRASAASARPASLCTSRPRWMADFPDGIWLVELAPVGDRTGRAGGSRRHPRRHRHGRLGDSRDDRPHAHRASGADRGGQLRAPARRRRGPCRSDPGPHDDATTVLATSREGLRVDGEQVWPVPSLDIDEGTARRRWTLRRTCPRGQPRIRAGRPDDEEAVIEICRRLDGIALAIELAAARMASMRPPGRPGPPERPLPPPGGITPRHRAA